MRKILVSAGHSNNPKRDRGAAANGYVEGDLTAVLRGKIYDYLKSMGADVEKDADDTVLGDSIRIFQQKNTPDCIIWECHFNAGPPMASGTETFVSVTPTYFEKKLAQALSEKTSEILQIPLRGHDGVKLETESQHPKGLGWMRLTGQNVLQEICFISNKDEMLKYTSKLDHLAVGIGDVLLTFANEVSGMPVEKQRIHIVRSGDSLTLLAKIYGTSVDDLKRKNGLNDDMIYISQQLKV